MTGLVADVAGLAATLGAVARNVSRFVASVAVLHRETAAVVTLGATAGDVAGLVTVVTAHLGSLLLAVFSDVADTIAAVAQILILFAFTRKMSILVALEALFTASAETTVATVPATTRSTTLGALPGKVTHPITLVTSA